jgi:hypothetical protein
VEWAQGGSEAGPRAAAGRPAGGEKQGRGKRKRGEELTPGGRRAPTGGPGVTARERGRKEARGVADGLSRPMG